MSEITTFMVHIKNKYRQLKQKYEATVDTVYVIEDPS